jgi:hypothetical protein
MDRCISQTTSRPSPMTPTGPLHLAACLPVCLRAIPFDSHSAPTTTRPSKKGKTPKIQSPKPQAPSPPSDPTAARLMQASIKRPPPPCRRSKQIETYSEIEDRRPPSRGKERERERERERARERRRRKRQSSGYQSL